MSYDLVVRGGTIVTAADRFVGDVGIRGGRIVAIGDGLPRASRGESTPAASRCSRAGSTCTRTSTSISADMRSVDDFESGTAAAAGGRRHDDLRLRLAARRVDAGADRRGVEGAGRRPGARRLRLPRRRQRRERGRGSPRSRAWSPKATRASRCS